MGTRQDKAAELFDAVVELGTPAERAAYLDAACGQDSQLRAELEELLAHDGAAGSFLDLSGPPEQQATTAETSVSERPGTVIGPYKLLEQIGEGGFGVVFMAEQTQPIRRRVALKVLKPGMDTRQVVARFEAERQALALMDHPNIAHVFDGSETASGRPYFVMELVRGIPITDFCDQNRLSIVERLKLFVTVCQAVQHAHQKGIIHRDIKPSNVLVTLQDDKALVKVIDFGVAKATGQQLTEKTLFTNFAQMIGTPLYMSPEQAELTGLDVDTRSDIYSLGVLLYELLTGTTPFEKERLKAASFDEIRRVIREEEPPKPSTRISTLGQAATTALEKRGGDPRKLSRLFRGELDWIVMKALEKDRNRRYETASAFAADVGRYLKDEPVQASPPSKLYRIRKFALRKKSALAMAACVFLALAGIAGSAGWAVRDRAARDHDQQVREAALDDEVNRLLDEAGPLIEQGKWLEALAVVERAGKLLAAAGRMDRPARLVELRKDLILAESLEAIYQQPRQKVRTKLTISGGSGTEHAFREERDPREEEVFWGRQQDAEFATAFREGSIDIDALEPSEAAAQIVRRTIRPALVKALDGWAPLRRRARGENDPGWKKLIEIASQADPNDWRNGFRDALLHQDRAALEKLADTVPIREVPPPTVYLLGHALKELGAVDKAMAMLREGHRHHPEDFWLNDVLGYFSKEFCHPPRYDDALRYYTVTVALRPANVRPHWSVAHLLMKKGVIDEAIGEYTKAIELEPKNVEAWIQRGSAYRDLHLRDYDQAVADFSKVIELDPKNPWPWHERGWAYREARQYDKALADSTKAIELDPKYVWAWFNRSYTYRELHEYDKALADATKAIELDPKTANLWHARAATYRELHQYNKALADSTKAIELDPKNWEFWISRALTYKELDQDHRAFADFSKAIELKTKAIELNPKNVAAWNDRGWVYFQLHQLDEAIADFNKAIDLYPKLAGAWVNRGHCYIHLHLYDRAIADLTKSIELDPKVASTWNNRAWAYLEIQEWDKALADVSQAIKLNPMDAEAWRNRGVIYDNLHQYDKALADYAKASELNPKLAMYWNLQARLLATCPDAKFRDAARAVRLAKKAVAMSSQDARYWRTLGAAYYRAGTWKEAIEALEKSMELGQGGDTMWWARTRGGVGGLEKSMELGQGGDSFDWFFLAMAHWQLGNKDEARRWYEKAVEWMDKNQQILERLKPWDEELGRCRAEAQELLNVKK
jgi:tetratricopeptide (TPR) repeat protein